MKKFILILGFVLAFSAIARADICYDINEQVATKASEIIKTQNEIYQYCSICPNADVKTIPVSKVQNGNPIYVNDIALDLAHTYYKKDNKFINLGVASGCIEAGEYDIQAELDNLLPLHPTKENYKQQATENTQKIYKQCIKQFQKKSPVTTIDMMEQNQKINNCLTDAINQEIKKGFDTKNQAQMIEYVSQIREMIQKFYFSIYSENKYCYGRCGTITNILPQIDENKMLMELLEKLSYLNISKSGY